MEPVDPQRPEGQAQHARDREGDVERAVARPGQQEWEHRRLDDHEHRRPAVPYAERDRELLQLYRAEYEQKPKEIAQPLKDVIEAAEIFESEQVRKDQFGAIEDAQKAQFSSEAGMSKGATAGSIAIATGCIAATALAQPEIAIPCVIGGALYTGAVKLAH